VKRRGGRNSRTKICNGELGLIRFFKGKKCKAWKIIPKNNRKKYQQAKKKT
jgi:hypothetical protein